MKKTLICAAAALLAACGGCCCSDCNDAGAAGDPQAMMAKMMELGTPGQRHEVVMGLVGTWNAENKMWMDPAGEPELTTGTLTVRPAHDGRYVIGEYRSSFKMPGQDGKMMDVPFSGTQIWGFSNADGEYQSTWIDSFSTGQMRSSGKPGSNPNVVEEEGSMMGPDERGNIVKQRHWMKTTRVNPDRYVMEMWSECQGIPKHKSMEITYTRTGR
ncbi:MAG TPA: DUF1579 family protein [Phycisphaerales bacterium]|nr:DUF1579 family protein [Phycisphaerales bacterium]